MFKKIFAAVVMAVSFIASPALAANRDFTLVNRTGYQITEVYVSPVRAKTWEEDVLGQDTLDNNDRVKITFDGAASACHWDLKAIYSDGTVAEWSDFNLCEVSTIVVHYDEKSGETSATYE